MLRLLKFWALALLLAVPVTAAEINDFDPVDANNIARWPEGMAFAQVNDSARADEGILARFYRDVNGSLTTAGSSNAYTITANQTISAYYTGLWIRAKASFTNTGSATLNVDTVGAVTLKKANGANLASGDIVSGTVYDFVHDGTNFQVLQLNALSDGIITSAKIADGTIATVDIANDAVTYAKMQNISAQFRALGRNSSGAGDAEEVSLTQLLDWIGSAAQGDILYRGASAWARLGAGASGQFLQTQGAGANPQWAVASALLGTEQATTSGTAIDFSSIPSSAKRVEVVFNEVSLSGTDSLLVQIGDSGGVETTGYVSTSQGIIGASTQADTSSTSGFVVRMGDATRAFSGIVTLVRVNSSALWVATHTGRIDTNAISTGGGHKTLSTTLDRVRITRSGTDTFDAGSVNIVYE